jgi:hypothetical protein
LELDILGGLVKRTLFGNLLFDSKNIFFKTKILIHPQTLLCLAPNTCNSLILRWLLRKYVIRIDHVLPENGYFQKGSVSEDPPVSIYRWAKRLGCSKHYFEIEWHYRRGPTAPFHKNMGLAHHNTFWL